MNNFIFNITLLISVICTTFAEQTVTESVVICFDLDNTLIAKRQTWKRDLLIMWQAFPWYINALWDLKTEQAKDKYGTKRFKAATGNSPALAPSGCAISLAFYGIHGKNGKKLQSIIPALLRIDCEYTVLVPGANTLLNYLKNVKKHHIVYASNKDYVTYVITAKKIDLKDDAPFSTYPTFVLLAQPIREYLDKTLQTDDAMPLAFKKLVEEVKNAQEDGTIFFAPEEEKKPEDSYYTVLKEKIKATIPDHGIVLFFDDKKYNVDAAIRNGISASYHVKSKTEVASIIKGLEAESLLSPDVDMVLYEMLAKEGVIIERADISQESSFAYFDLDQIMIKLQSFWTSGKAVLFGCE